MGQPDWTISEDWDALFLNGFRVLGVARVDAKLPSGLDIQKPKGGKKATTKDDGAPPVEFAIEVEFTWFELAAFEADIVPILRPKSKDGRREPVPIVHPVAAMWGVTDVTIGPIDSPSPRAGGSMLVKFTAYEWTPAPVTPKKKKPADTGNSEDWDAQRRIDALRPSQASEDNMSTPQESSMSEEPSAGPPPNQSLL